MKYKIETMYGRSNVNVKVEGGSTFMFTHSFSHIFPILSMHVKPVKVYVRMHVKITRQWKSTFKLSEGQLSASLPLTRRSSSYIFCDLKNCVNLHYTILDKLNQLINFGRGVQDDIVKRHTKTRKVKRKKSSKLFKIKKVQKKTQRNHDKKSSAYFWGHHYA